MELRLQGDDCQVFGGSVNISVDDIIQTVTSQTHALQDFKHEIIDVCRDAQNRSYGRSHFKIKSLATHCLDSIVPGQGRKRTSFLLELRLLRLACPSSVPVISVLTFLSEPFFLSGIAAAVGLLPKSSLVYSC